MEAQGGGLEENHKDITKKASIGLAIRNAKCSTSVRLKATTPIKPDPTSRTKWHAPVVQVAHPKDVVVLSQDVHVGRAHTDAFYDITVFADMHTRSIKQ
eukprot:1159603-Pelagomonas_calceolata.AAC.7